MHERLVKWRLWGGGAALLLAMCGLAGRLFSLHVGSHATVSRPWEAKLTARRGAIYDRNGENNPMAVSLTLYQPFLDPLSIKPKHDPRTIAALVGERLNLNMGDILERFSSTNSRHQLLPILVEERDCKALSTNKNISGVGWEERIVRTYPHARRMSSVLGFVNKEGTGGGGIEQHFESYLKGIPGRIESEKDGLQNEIAERRTEYVPPRNGASVYLTLDNNIQYKVEEEVRQVAQEFNATAAWALVEKVETGEILAMVSWPDFDPNHYGDSSSMEWRNLPICVNYEPGSTMKAFTIGAALNEGVVTPATRIDVGQGSWFYGGRILRDHAEGVIDVPTIIKKSSNIGAAKIALMLGNQRESAYFHAFGFGDRLGIDLPGEESGILHSLRNWNMLTPTRIAIGQGISVTGLQLLNGYCAIANNGRLMRPYVVSRIVDSDTNVLYEAHPTIMARPLRPEIAAQLRNMLIGVTEEGGTATRAAVTNYTVAGKTGTSQMPVPGGGRYSDTDFWASFVGVLPAEKPVFGLLVVVERPHPQHMGGYVAAPVFSHIAEAVARYLEIPASLNVDVAGTAVGRPTGPPLKGKP